MWWASGVYLSTDQCMWWASGVYLSADQCMWWASGVYLSADQCIRWTSGVYLSADQCMWWASGVYLSADQRAGAAPEQSDPRHERTRPRREDLESHCTTHRPEGAQEGNTMMGGRAGGRRAGRLGVLAGQSGWDWAIWLLSAWPQEGNTMAGGRAWWDLATRPYNMTDTGTTLLASGRWHCTRCGRLLAGGEEEPGRAGGGEEPRAGDARWTDAVDADAAAETHLTQTGKVSGYQPLPAITLIPSPATALHHTNNHHSGGYIIGWASAHIDLRRWKP